MKKFRLTSYEASWLRILGVLGALTTAFFVARYLWPVTPEPLADPMSLRLLMEGESLPIPAFEKEASFLGQKAIPPTLASLTTTSKVLGATNADKRIEVDLTHQRVYAFEASRRVYEFPVSTGKWAPTPTGEFDIWVKVRSQKMSGGTPGTGTYYYLPNVPYVMFFANSQVDRSRGFSLHGTYWHNNFGHPMSHGCVNMRIEDAKTLFEWADPLVVNTKAWSTLATAENPGTRVVIYGEAPKE